jgi:hypothetical protein
MSSSHRIETFKFSCDPEFDAKLADIVGALRRPARSAAGAVRE